MPKKLSQNEIESIMEKRNLELQSIKPFVSLSFFHKANDKLSNELDELLAIAGLQNKRQLVLDEYSFILDSTYFEQHFLQP